MQLSAFDPIAVEAASLYSDRAGRLTGLRRGVKMAFEGSCHCGAVVFKVSQDPPAEAMSCNCSHCSRKGLLLSFSPAEVFSLIGSEEMLTDYYFNKHAIAHRFCSKCGCQPFGHGKGPNGAEMAAINLRCVPSIDLDKLRIQKVDGASF